ncbi:MAG TPA: hypothetical protein VHB97_27650 [Polyangia bacterium]|jgi:hypothetical protein|nr:hypothetical protein [Polyangia bacterium]
MPRLFALLLLLSTAVGCRTPPLDYDGGAFDDLATGSGQDLAAPRDLHATPTSCCGVDGNPGNELGVGKFCQSSLDCTGQQANICASTFAPGLTFCTKACTMGGGNAQCGSGAQCQCANGQCACVPGECVMPPPGC